MSGPFVDKNGVEIKPGDVVRFVSDECVGEAKGRRGTRSVYKEIEIIGTVRLGLFKTVSSGELYTYWIDTDQTIKYPTYFFAIRARDLPRMYTAKMSRALSTGVAAKCEVLAQQPPARAATE